MSEILGAIPLSPAILKKTRIGLWAFELDEGLEPRMYVDNAMLGLLGLDHQLPPEETYHAWYDNVDDNCYDLVSEAVAKMTAGNHAEVQYPWHHPDGHIMNVCCGGVRNFAYTRGIRIEGYHQDVSNTSILTYEMAKQKQRLESDYRTIQGLANEYDTLHLLNLDTDEFTPFYIENESMMDTEFLLASFDGFYSALRASIESIVHPDYREKMLKFTDKRFLRFILRNKRRHVERILIKNSRGEYCWNDFVVLKFADADKEAGKIAVGYINVDEEMKSLLSERERLEKFERKAEEERRAKEAETERYNFLINVTHEIRTPLTLIMGPLERLQSSESLSEKGLKTVMKVRQQASKMSVLLNTVLTSNKIEDQAESVKPVPCDFNNWVAGTADDFSEEAESRGMSIRYNLDPAIKTVEIDEHLCNIILYNFMVNALRYNTSGSELVVKSEIRNGGESVRVSVIDRGPGIGDIDAYHLFERYYRATEDKTGFGIGLFYSKRIVEAHNGRIGAFNNSDGSGATFWFEIPTTANGIIRNL